MEYIFFFVVTLEAGRIRAEDMTTIKVVLESASDVKNYSLIINRIMQNSLKFWLQNCLHKVTAIKFHQLSCYCRIKSSYTMLKTML